MKQSLFTLALLVGLAVSARAQVHGGTIGGTIHDEQGGVLPGITVTLRGADAARDFTTDADGSHVKRITHSVGANTSPSWNPKTGQEVAFVSDRGGTPQLYTMDAEGAEAQKVPLPDMGYVIDPAWSPNGQLLAFSWRRPNGNYDLYIMDVATHDLVELTRDAGRNERPSWAPDGRHMVFESTRTGTRQIWSMLADGTSARQLTSAGQNESASWSLK